MVRRTSFALAGCSVRCLSGLRRRAVRSHGKCAGPICSTPRIPTSGASRSESRFRSYSIRVCSSVSVKAQLEHNDRPPSIRFTFCVNEPSALRIAHLGTYLNDHLAGSVGALELVEHLAKNNSGTPLEEFFTHLHVEISADQDVLRDLMHTLEMEESAVRKAGAWVAEKLSRVKLGASEEKMGGSAFLQSLEGLTLGITGKQLLWRTLAAAAERFPQLKGPDYAKLEQRAVVQLDLVEEKRLVASRQAFQEAPE